MATRWPSSTSRGSGQLDFDSELLPLLKREMAYVYRATLDGAAPDPAAYTPDPRDEVLIDSLLFPLRGRRFATLDAFRQFFLDWLRADLAEAALGNVGSAVKALKPEVRVLGAEPETAAPAALSFAAGCPREFPDWKASFVDGAGGHGVFPRMWERMKPLVDKAEISRQQFDAYTAAASAADRRSGSVTISMSGTPLRLKSRYVLRPESGSPSCRDFPASSSM